MIALLVATLLAADLQVIEADGSAPLALGYTQAAQQAKDRALRAVVLKACKQIVGADATVAQCAIADDRLYAGFQGLVSKLDVLSTQSTDSAVTVRVRAEISLKTAQSETLEAQRLFKRLGTLKLGIGIVENPGIITRAVTAFFMNDGWKIFPLPPNDGRSISKIQQEAKAVAVDYALVGVPGRLKVLEVATARFVSDVSFAQADDTLGPQLRSGIVKSLRDAEKNGVEVTLTLHNVKSADDALSRLQGLTVLESALDGDVFTATVKSQKPARELAKALAKSFSVTTVSTSSIEAVLDPGSTRAQ